jgi:maleate isomerase
MPPHPKPHRLGILVPSSNTALEPLTQALIASLNPPLSPASIATPKITVHYSRLPVTSISLSPLSLSQFQHEKIVAAAQLLAHAEVDVIGWAGTSAGWLVNGFMNDEALCEEVERVTGVRCTTSVVALGRVLEMYGVKRLGLVTPYGGEVVEAIVRNYAGIGVQVVEEAHLGLERNTEIAEVGEVVLDGLVREVVYGGKEKAELKVDAVCTFCTNWVAAQRVEFWEKEHGVPVFDTVSVVIWDMLRIAGWDVKSVKGWGGLFQKES